MVFFLDKCQLILAFEQSMANFNDWIKDVITPPKNKRMEPENIWKYPIPGKGETSIKTHQFWGSMLLFGRFIKAIWNLWGTEAWNPKPLSSRLHYVTITQCGKALGTTTALPHHAARVPVAPNRPFLPWKASADEIVNPEVQPILTNQLWEKVLLIVQKSHS